MADLAALRTKVLDRIGVPSTDPQFPTALLNRFVNDAVHFIETDHDWPWLDASATITTAAGTSTYAFPADYRRTRSILAPSGGQLVPMPRYAIDELDDRWPTSGARGRPAGWGVDGEQIVLRPVPNAALTLTHRYVKAEPDLAVDADTPLMPSAFHPAIAEVATWMALRRDQQDPRAVSAWAAWAGEQTGWRYKMLDDSRRYQGPARVRVRSDYR